MTYELNTPGNLAVQSLVSGGRCRVTVSGEAPVKLGPGTYKLSANIGTKAARIAGMFKVYDSGDTGDYCEVRCRLDNTSIVDEGGSITATNMEAAIRGEVSSFEWQAVLTEAVGEWILEVRTDGESKQTPLDFSGFSIVEVQEGEEWALGVDTDDLVEGAVTEPILAAGAVTPEKVADPDVFFGRKERYAAFSGRGPKGTGHFASIVWDPSQDSSISVKLSAREAPSGTTTILGTAAASKWHLRVHVDGSIDVRENATVLAASAAGVFLFDGTIQTIGVALTGTTVAITRNGTEVASGTFATITWASQTTYIGALSPTSTRWPGTIHDVLLTDNSVPANSVRLRLDERVGNYRNSYPSTTATGYATRNGVVESIVIHDVDGTALPVPAVPPARMRYAACSGLGASGSGEFASVAMTISAGTSFRLGLTVATSVAPAAQCYVFGVVAANRPSIRISTTGVVELLAQTTQILASAAGAVAFNGGVYRIAVDVTDTTGAIYVNDALVASGTFGAQSWATSSGTFRIGAASGGQRWPGSIHNVEFTDYVTASNSRFYLMDEPSGNYADTSGNGGAAATRNGYVHTCAVQSTDGRGMVYQGGRQLRYAGYRNAAYVMDGALGASANLQLDNDTLDPTASLALGTDQVWVAPCAGIVTGCVAITLEANADPPDSGTLMVKDATNEWAKVYVEIGARAAQGVVTIPFMRSVVAGDYARIRCEGIAATTGCPVTRVEFSLTLDPTPVAN